MRDGDSLPQLLRGKNVEANQDLLFKFLIINFIVHSENTKEGLYSYLLNA